MKGEGGWVTKPTNYKPHKKIMYCIKCKRWKAKCAYPFRQRHISHFECGGEEKDHVYRTGSYCILCARESGVDGLTTTKTKFTVPTAKTDDVVQSTFQFIDDKKLQSIIEENVRKQIAALIATKFIAKTHLTYVNGVTDNKKTMVPKDIVKHLEWKVKDDLFWYCNDNGDAIVRNHSEGNN